MDAYRTVPLSAPDPALLARVAAADALDAHRHLVGPGATWRCARPTARRCPCPGTWSASGPATAAAARAAGLAGVHEAWGASAEGIVAELVDHFGAGGGGGS